MKKKDLVNNEELERINSELFGAFDPEDESWIVGGSKSVTTFITYSPCCVDAGYDFDWAPGEIEELV